MYQIAHSPQEGDVPLQPISEKELEVFVSKADQATKNLLELHQFKGQWGSFFCVTNAKGELERVLVGTKNPENDPRHQIHLFAKLAQTLPAAPYTLEAPSWDGSQKERATLGWGLGQYEFSAYKRKRKQKDRPLLCVPGYPHLNRTLHELKAIFLARDLINTPANDLGPYELATKVREIGEAAGAKVHIIEGDGLLAANYPAIHAVGKGSSRKPALADLRWGNPDHPKVTLVGKGVVFDTGGLDLKPAKGMGLMKKDMGGSAVALALAGLIMDEQLPVHLRLLIPTVENSPGLDAYRPSDVIKTRSGRSVEIGNTDAEGRVILCDALTEAASEKPDLLVDLATLTGAARVALGQDLPGFWTEDEAIANGLYQASSLVADPIWRMPLWMPYRKHLKSHVADLSNMADTGFGGALTAALYLHEFVKPLTSWVHFDIYGWTMYPRPGSPKGGEANALRAVFRYIADRFGGSSGGGTA